MVCVCTVQYVQYTASTVDKNWSLKAIWLNRKNHTEITIRFSTQFCLNIGRILGENKLLEREREVLLKIYNIAFRAPKTTQSLFLKVLTFGWCLWIRVLNSYYEYVTGNPVYVRISFPISVTKKIYTQVKYAEQEKCRISIQLTYEYILIEYTYILYICTKIQYSVYVFLIYDRKWTSYRWQCRSSMTAFCNSMSGLK